MYYLSLEMVQKAFDFFFNFSLFGNPYFGTGTPLWAPVPPLLVPDSQSMLHMLNNFCFHVYAEMSLFMGVNDNDKAAAAPLPVSGPIIELVPS